MDTQFLKKIATERLPRLSYRPADIRAIRSLSNAGLLIAQFSDRDDYGEIPYALVLAITAEGHRECLQCPDRALRVPDARLALPAFLRSSEAATPTVP